MPDTMLDSFSFDDEKLYLVYERCQAVTNLMTTAAGQGPSNHVNSDSREDIDEDYLNSYSPSARI